MKIAMQTLISKLQTEISELNKKIDKYPDGKDVYIGHKYGLDHALSVAESLLEMEKEQMIAFALFRDNYFENAETLDEFTIPSEDLVKLFKQQEQ